MKTLLHYLIFVLIAVPGFALQQPCSSPPALVVHGDFVIEGTAYTGEQPLRLAQVSLYSRHKLVRRVATDAEARFMIDHLSPGICRLSIQRLGSFNVKVVTTAVEELQQRRYYFFSRSRNGCLNWGFDTN
ncbi:MAG TPA: hypothetical protein VFK81_08235 [Terriglobales bacterium]|nr:hypothetical protein [Terriglobales bacterium]HVG92528.1 hypothetical protein [Alphaproteobacteria bacterium]